MTRQLQPCGTVAASQRHRYHGEPVCDLCRAAVNARSESRRKDPEVHTAMKERSAAYSRAMTRLVNEYRDRFSEIYAEEKKRTTP